MAAERALAKPYLRFLLWGSARTGHELADLARGCGVPVILVAGHPDDLAALEAVPGEHLAKPFGPFDLVALIKRCLGS